MPSSIDTKLVGESARENALPWDTIETTRFKAGDPLTSMIESLVTRHTERSKDDPNFEYQLDRIRASKRIREQKTVSLDINARRATREGELTATLNRENNRRVAMGLERLESLDDFDDEEFPDIQLDQAAKIVADMAALRKVSSLTAQTAQMRP